MIVNQHGKEYAKCELCPKFATQANAYKLGWDWFTGILPRSYHYCDKCRHTKEHHEMLHRSGCMPCLKSGAAK